VGTARRVDDFDAAAPEGARRSVVPMRHMLLIRMNSEADLGHLRDAFSFVPDGLIQRATTFRQGESLVAGKIVPHPAYVRFGQRLSQEGGADIPMS
jgi:uncharacterized protein